jgi:hypothetical protein
LITSPTSSSNSAPGSLTWDGRSTCEVGGDDFFIDLLFYLKLRAYVVIELKAGKFSGIAEYQLAQSLPESLQANLPTIEQIERELAGGQA